MKSRGFLQKYVVLLLTLVSGTTSPAAWAQTPKVFKIGILTDAMGPGTPAPMGFGTV